MRNELNGTNMKSKVYIFAKMNNPVSYFRTVGTRKPDYSALIRYIGRVLSVVKHRATEKTDGVFGCYKMTILKIVKYD